MIRVVTLIIALVCFCNISVSKAQSFRKDSLQIKVYTLAEFSNSELKNIKLRKIFCDYCSEKQLNVIGELGLKKAKEVVKSSRKKVNNGTQKIAVYLRVSREDFIKFKD